MVFLSEQIRDFRQKYPLVQFSIHSAIADDIKEHMETGSVLVREKSDNK